MMPNPKTQPKTSVGRARRTLSVCLAGPVPANLIQPDLSEPKPESLMSLELIPQVLASKLMLVTHLVGWL